jgi:hypothetical protein
MLELSRQRQVEARRGAARCGGRERASHVKDHKVGGVVLPQHVVNLAQLRGVLNIFQLRALFRRRRRVVVVVVQQDEATEAALERARKVVPQLDQLHVIGVEKASRVGPRGLMTEDGAP